MPELLEVFLRLAKEHGIRAVRCVQRDRCVTPLTLKKIYKVTILSCLRSRVEALIKLSSVRCTDGYFGFLDAGYINEEIMMKILGKLPEGVTELNLHPGFMGPEILQRYRFHMNCEQELYSVTSPRVKKIIKNAGIKLITYGDFLRAR